MFRDRKDVPRLGFAKSANVAGSVIAVNLVQLGVVLLAGVTWEKWLSSRSVFQLRQNLSPALGGLIAYFIATFIFYWWHRWRHRVDALWLMFHQIHHSPQRIEVITSFYKHPLEMIVNSIIGSLLVYSFLGLGLKSGAIYTACTAVGEFFYQCTNAAVGRLLFSKAGNAPNPSPIQQALQQLWRHRLVGHAFRYIRKST